MRRLKFALALLAVICLCGAQGRCYSTQRVEGQTWVAGNVLNEDVQAFNELLRKAELARDKQQQRLRETP